VDVGDYVGSAMARPRMRRSSGIDTCKDTCVNEFTDAVFTCIHQYEADVANCKAAYPDQGPEYDSCIDDAHEDRENCLTAASHRLAICYALCDKENAGPVNPVEPEPLP